MSLELPVGYMGFAIVFMDFAIVSIAFAFVSIGFVTVSKWFAIVSIGFAIVYVGLPFLRLPILAIFPFLEMSGSDPSGGTGGVMGTGLRVPTLFPEGFSYLCLLSYVPVLCLRAYFYKALHSSHPSLGNLVPLPGFIPPP